MTDKPPFRVPSMSEIAKTPWNGFNVASTFSGCGGSSLGYKMAGFRVLWANEFVPAAQETYRLNHPKTFLNIMDVRKITGERMLNEMGLERGDLDVLDGSPPCSSYSTAGAKEKLWGQSKTYSDTKQRTDDLFTEFIRLLSEVRPKTFVAENVPGLIRGVSKGFFIEIMAGLRGAGYNVRAQVLEAQWLGVPQDRKRLIFIGVREDLHMTPVHPKPLPYRYTVKDAWGDALRVEPIEPETSLEKHREKGNARFWFMLKPGETHPKRFNAMRHPINAPSHVLHATQGIPGSAQAWHPTEFRAISVAEARRLSTFPDDFAFAGGYFTSMERIGRAVPPVMMMHVASAVRDHILSKLPVSAHV